MKTDTPRTDEKAQFFGWNPDEGEEFVTASFCRELERENIALRAALDAQMKYQRDLRADRDRLDWLETLDCDSHLWVHLADSTNLRDAIDSAQNEAQP